MLKIEDLHVYYGGVYALKGLTLEIPDNAIVSLLGANGAGKSTTLRSICGLVKPRTGRILFGENDVDLTKMEPAEIQKLGIAVIPEGRRVFTGLTVMENLKMGAWNRKDPDGIAEDIDEIYSMGFAEFLLFLFSNSFKSPYNLPYPVILVHNFSGVFKPCIGCIKICFPHIADKVFYAAALLFCEAFKIVCKIIIIPFRKYI